MKKADPISTEIIRNAFISIAQDMNAVLIRSAYTPVIYEGKDCVVALLDEKGEVLGQSSGLPLFLGNLQVCVQETAKIYGWDYFKEGDIFFDLIISTLSPFIKCVSKGESFPLILHPIQLSPISV